MRVALIAPPFIPVPPPHYGGTELFLARLAEGLKARGHQPVLFTNGESTMDVEKHWLYAKSEWPIKGEIYDNLKDSNHCSWAVEEASRDCDVIHLNNVTGLMAARFVPQPAVYTVHHPHIAALTEIYRFFPKVSFVTISDFQRRRETMPDVRTIHHGINVAEYPILPGKRSYLAFLGRIAPIKGTHIAIAVAKKAGIPLKLAGEVQPVFRDYFEKEVKPHVDGKFIDFVGPIGGKDKIKLLSHSLAFLFPIQWDEPFGLVMIEAMACGAPVLAFPGGSVPEIVRDGVSGYVCSSMEEMAARARDLHLEPNVVRAYVGENFALEKMVEQYITLYEQLAARAIPRSRAVA